LWRRRNNASILPSNVDHVGEKRWKKGTGEEEEFSRYDPEKFDQTLYDQIGGDTGKRSTISRKTKVIRNEDPKFVETGAIVFMREKGGRCL